MRQSTTLLQSQALQTCLFLSVQLDDQSASDVPTGWPHGHGLQPTAKAMAKSWMGGRYWLIMNIGPRTLQQTSAACLPCSGDLSTADSAGPVCLPVARTEYTVPGT